ncbi:MAG: NADH dehydrogenase (quinone) subunit D [Bdellovibrionales bacterium]|nr:NADH dehydrogenase (quinone) subunit D [Bdellovibrionales bacterium]
MSKSNNDKLKQDLKARFGNQSEAWQWSRTFGMDCVVIPREQVQDFFSFIKQNHYFDMLMNLTAVDYPGREKRFEVVYELFNVLTANRMRVKVLVAEGEEVPTLTKIWRGTDWFEREVYDMFGIRFSGHLNMRRILTHHQFVGHPLRKDYPADRQQPCTEAMPIFFDYDPRYKDDDEEGIVPLNIGPSHPATHGTLRVMAQLQGEKVHRAGVELGYLHRCFEKMAETHAYNQVIPYTDRLNYCSAPMNNIGYCKAVETMLGVEIPAKAQAMRVVLAELSRFIDHVVCIGANAVDLGALTGFFHLFTLREKVYSLFEKLCGARLTVSLTRVGGMAQDAPAGWFDDVLATSKELRQGVADIEKLLSNNKIWIQRCSGIGEIGPEEAVEWGYTGPLLRAAGVPLDLRKTDPYYIYDQLDFDIPVGTTGDVFDRYLVRIEEMKQSLRIVDQVCKNIPEGDFTIRDKAIVLPEKKDVYGNIEGLMNHFMLVINGLRPPQGEIYDATEAANGELGFYLVSDGSGAPYRLKVRPPCFAIYQSFPEQITGGLVADVIAILGSMNLIAGELDR